MKLYLDNRRTALYRLYDAAGQLLYIGITCNTEARFREHARTKDWWPKVERKDVVWYETRQEAFDVEYKAIAKESPPHNNSWNRDMLRNFTKDGRLKRH